MKLFKLIASKAGRVVFDDRIEAASPREAREQMRTLLGLQSLTGVVYAVTEIPVQLIESIVDARITHAMQRLNSGQPPESIDNLIRPMISNRYAQIHPLITLVGAIAGVSYIGLLGLLVGPLALSYFFELLTMYRREYLRPVVSAS